MDRINSGIGPEERLAKIRAEFAIATALVWALRVCPLGASNALARATARLLDTVVPRLRRVALTNLSFAFPQLDRARHDQIIDGVFRSIARMLVAVARFPSINRANVSEWI